MKGSQHQRIHVCHITQSSGAGVETYIQSILTNLNSHRFHHTVVCPHASSLAESASRHGGGVVLVPMVRDPRPWRDALSMIRILSVVRALKPDLIHAHSGKGGAFGRIVGLLLDIPAVFTPNAFSYLAKKGVLRRLILWSEKLMASLPCTLLASSPSEAARAVTEVGWPSHRVVTSFPNSIEVSGFVRSRRATPVPAVVSVARLTFQKNPELLVRVATRVCSHLRGVRFTIMGAAHDDRMTREVSAMIADSGVSDRIQLEEWNSRRAVRQVLRDHDVYLSTSRYEGLPFSLLEALDAELPIVATNVDGNRDVVEHSVSGFLCNTEDELVQYVLQLLLDSQRRVDMGKNAKRILMERFDIKKNIGKLGELYESLAFPH